MKQCPFCLEFVGDEEKYRLVHVLDKHSTLLYMASAVLGEMRRQGVGWERSGDKPGYREWVEAQR